ncbi:MAG: GTP 3',8-cyclase MoaA [Syntrophales bacterium]|jgi:cyclic pyranopterin phosphate synthase|nr:GTP 3',8-cyclase MoaA [Syntrophales bacterium]MCK9528251.1 GTP 3',8-cyclase MoaA [Syntrophales bacterium]MDX9922382.1 GTP 3',8-cyclase MoaA [Syntrophales bacterium]
MAVMIDSFHREINYLRVSITDRCNLRCVYCMPKEGVSHVGHNDILRYEEILRIVRIAVGKGITKVRVTGGEPLVRSGVVEFLSALRSIEELRDITLTTNGILLEQFAEPIFEAGIKRINVSLDSLVPGKYRDITRGGDLNKVLRGLEKARETGFSPIKINVVGIEGFNDDEIPEFVRLAEDYPYQVRFIEYMPVGDTVTNDVRYLSNDRIMEEISRLHPLKPLDLSTVRDRGPARIFSLGNGLGEIGFISAISHQFCSSCNRLRLTADGHLRACLLTDDPEADLKASLRLGCTDTHLDRLIQSVIDKKPCEHTVFYHRVSRKKCVRSMSSIGG